jgi:CRISPR-associated protein Csd1
MIIKALVDYYEALVKTDENITVPGYSKVGVSYGLCLTDEGELESVITFKTEEVIRDVKTKKNKIIEKPRKMVVPEQQVRSVNVKPNFLCDNCSYFLGIDDKGKPERTKKCFEASKRLHLEILQGVDNKGAQAVCKFFNKWDISKARESTILAPYLKDMFKGANLIFVVNYTDFVQDIPKVKSAWETYLRNDVGTDTRLCVITGVRSESERIHGKIKCVKDDQFVRANLISFNSQVFESYGNVNSQGLNAPVSKYAAYAYVTALNHLLDNKKYKNIIGDTTVVCWAENASREMQDAFSYLNFDTTEGNEEKILDDIMNFITKGELPDIENIDFQTTFYVLGIAPNAARLSVRFFLKDSFGNLISNIAKHYRRLDIIKPDYEKKFLKLCNLLKETASPHPKDNVASPLLGGAVMRSILYDYPYPELLFTSVINRIKCQHNINPSKAAIIKACLIKNYKIEEESLVALNENLTDKPYVLGRLFAVLEKVQLDSMNKSKVNAKGQKEENGNIEAKDKDKQDENTSNKSTIKERYFTSACTTPSVIFPTLLKLSTFHLAKKEMPNYCRIDNEKSIGELIGKLEGEPIPDRLTLKEQGLFMLGYYHQRQKYFEGKPKADNKANNNNENQNNESEVKNNG